MGNLEAFQLDRTLAEAIETRRSYPEQEGVHEMMRARFGKLVEMNKEEWTHEFAHPSLFRKSHN